MKYVVFLADGMSGERLEELGNRTPLEYAHTPNINKLITEGRGGFVDNTPEGMVTASDVCCMSLFGYDPREYFTGRAALEAASIGLPLDDKVEIFRCNLITASANNDSVLDYSAGHIKKQHGERAVQILKETFKDDNNISFHYGDGYQCVMLCNNKQFDLETAPPHDILNIPSKEYLPKGLGEDYILEIQNKAFKVLNKADDIGDCNGIWLWSNGKKPSMPSFKEMYGMKASVVAAINLVKGISMYADIDVIEVEGATGYEDTNYQNKVDAVVEALKTNDIVFLHIDASDVVSHKGDTKLKVEVIETYDSVVIPQVVEALKSYDNYCLYMAPDHSTYITTRVHVDQYVPALLWGDSIEPDDNYTYSEFMRPTFVFEHGYEALEYIIEENSKSKN